MLVAGVLRGCDNLCEAHQAYAEPFAASYGFGLRACLE